LILWSSDFRSHRLQKIVELRTREIIQAALERTKESDMSAWVQKRPGLHGHTSITSQIPNLSSSDNVILCVFCFQRGIG
jgi:hypothetical protein